jgi:hypothetical protein
MREGAHEFVQSTPISVGPQAESTANTHYHHNFTHNIHFATAGTPGGANPSITNVVTRFGAANSTTRIA